MPWLLVKPQTVARAEQCAAAHYTASDRIGAIGPPYHVVALRRRVARPHQQHVGAFVHREARVAQERLQQ